MRKKNFIYTALCICVAVLLSGCGTPGTGTEVVSSPTPTMIAMSNPVVGTKEPTVAPVESLEITIYTLNTENLEKEAVSVLVEVESELTPELIVEQVADAMEDEGFLIGVNEIIADGDSVIVDFRSDAAPVCDVGASVEGAILDIIGQSILDNLPQYKSIIYRIEGGAYQTGHLEFEYDEVYIGR